MTTRITIECDGLLCSKEIEIPSDNDEHIEKAGWGVFDGGDTHYCPKCLKAVEKELADEDLAQKHAERIDGWVEDRGIEDYKG